MPTLATTVDVLNLFADPTRVRLLALLVDRELSVAELTAITELAQPRVSTHLGRLREAGVVRDRRAGASTFYSFNQGAMPAEAKRVWSLLASGLDDTVLHSDRKRCEAVLRSRESDTPWPDAVAGEMERHYSPGRTWESIARGFLALVRLGDVLDVGSGDGSVAQLLAPRARSITCLDSSERVIAAARARLGHVRHVRYLVGDMHAIAQPPASFDHVLLFNSLTYAQSPPDVLSECARVLRPGGALAVITLDAHAHRDVTAAYQHRHTGFRPTALRSLLTRAGLTVDECEVTSRERRAPYFQVITACAHKAATTARRRRSSHAS